MKSGSNYTELKADTLSNPFTRSQPNKLWEIYRNKYLYLKYIIIFSCLILVISCIIILISKSSKIKSLHQSHVLYEKQIRNLKEINKQTEQTLWEKDDELKQLVNAHELLVKNNHELLKEKQQLVKIINVDNTNLNNILLTKIQAETFYYDKIRNENNDIEMIMDELTNKIGQLKKEINELQTEYDNLLSCHEFGISIISRIFTGDKCRVLRSWFPNKKLRRIYKPTRKTFTIPNFHQAVDSFNNIVVIIKLENKNIIGGYTSNNWSGEGWKRDREAFLFNISKGKKYNIYDESKAIKCSPNQFPIFGDHDFTLNLENFESKFPNTYGRDSKPLELTDFVEITSITDLEIYTIL